MQHFLKCGGTNYHFKWVTLNIWLTLSYTISFYLQENLSKMNFLGTNFCVCNRQVFTLYRLIYQRCPTLEQFIQYSGLFRVLFRHAPLYIKTLFQFFFIISSIWVRQILFCDISRTHHILNCLVHWTSRPIYVPLSLVCSKMWKK
jgi:hypothetical protein